MTLTRNSVVAFATATALFALAIAFVMAPFRADALSASNLSATVATSSTPTVTSTASTVFASTTGGNCASRTISTASSSIMIGFNDALTPNAVRGFTQAASTTVNYPSSSYGCGLWRIYSFSTQTITVEEAR